jgi:hypothetical protein
VKGVSGGRCGGRSTGKKCLVRSAREAPGEEECAFRAGIQPEAVKKRRVWRRGGGFDVARRRGAQCAAVGASIRCPGVEGLLGITVHRDEIQLLEFRCCCDSIFWA